MGAIFGVSELWLIGVVGFLSAETCDVRWPVEWLTGQAGRVSVYLAERQRGEFHTEKDKDKEIGNREIVGRLYVSSERWRGGFVVMDSSFSVCYAALTS